MDQLGTLEEHIHNSVIQHVFVINFEHVFTFCGKNIAIQDLPSR